jgi:hypothetical protein
MSLAVVLLILGANATPADAQCSVASNSGENLYVRDAIGGCRSTPLVGGKPASKLRVRRDISTHILVFKHGVEQGVPRTSRGSISNERSGIANFIGYKEFDLTLPAGAALGDMTITIGTVLTGDHAFTLAVDRRGEITAFTQTPSPARWGDPVQVSFTGRDIGNASARVGDHTVSGIVSTSTSLQLTAKAAITTARTRADVTAWDKANSASLGRYVRVGQPVPGQITYSTEAAPAVCTSVPGIGAPQLSQPATGAVMSFASATSPLMATVSFAWPQSGDPQRKYILHLESALITTNTITTTRTGSTTTLAPLTSSDVTVGPFSSTSPGASVTRQLTRNRAYKWRVRAVNCGQTAPWSGTSSFTVK